jgi:hypothetical protein
MKVKGVINATRICAAGILLLATGTASATVGVRVIVENRAPENGTWLTPIWVGFQSDSFDLYDLDVPASEELERLAEDGNAAPLRELFELQMPDGVDGLIGSEPIAPGQTVERTFVLDNNDFHVRYFTYGSMVIPSNDAFIALEDPAAQAIFDGFGNFLGAYIVIDGTDVLDAGTEVNDEIPEHTAFFGQTEPDSGVDEYSVVHPHPGYLPPGSGGILDDPMFEGADFTQPGYEVARITIIRSDTVVPSGAVSGTWDVDGSPYLLQGDVVVPFGETLIIEPGVQVVSLCDCRLVVEGSMLAFGTPEAPILFTKDSTIPEWHGLHFFYGSEPSRLSHCIVEYGDADDTIPDDQGGGIYCEESALYLDHCTVRYNDAYEGGGIYAIGSDLTASHCQLVDNTAEDGAAARCDWSNVLLFANDITGNLAWGATGGGIYLDYCDAFLLQNNISDNQAYASDFYDPAHANGGGVAFTGHTLATLIANRITANLAHAEYEYGSEAKGAGIWSDGGPDLMLINNTIADNTASASPDWNEKHGGGLYVYSSDITVINGIMWNDIPQEISSPSEYGITDITVSYSDVQGGQGAVEIHPNHDLNWLAGNIDSNPLFVNPAAADYSLQDDSPCIDAGDPDYYPDPDGTLRDMGALATVQQGSLVADFDGDLDVDAGDMGAFAACMAGPEVTTPPPACAAPDFAQADLDDDLDADLMDAALLLGYATGSYSGACCVMGQCVELPEYFCMQVDGVFHGNGTTCPETSCDFWEYENITDFTFNWPRPGAGVSIADDLELAGSGIRQLYYYSLLVGAWEGEPYDCTVELWTDCPGNGGQPIPGTSHTWTDLPILQSSELEAEFDNVEIPANVWMVVTFSTDYAGWFVADEAEVGYTTDYYGLDLPPWSCTEVVPDDEYFSYYSGFWAIVRCR